MDERNTAITKKGCEIKMTSLWRNYKTVSQETIDSLRPFFKDSTDEEIKEALQSNAEDELKYLQNVLDKLYPGPICIMAISMNSEKTYYVTHHNATGRDIINYTENEDCHYFWDNDNLYIDTGDKRFVIRFTRSITINNLRTIQKIITDDSIPAEKKIALIEPFTKPIPEMELGEKTKVITSLWKSHDARRDLAYIQSELDKAFPNPAHILAVNMTDKHSYYITEHIKTGRDLLIYTANQNVHYFWDKNELYLQAEKRLFVIRFIKSTKPASILKMKRILENDQLSAAEKMAQLEDFTSPVPVLNLK